MSTAPILINVNNIIKKGYQLEIFDLYYLIAYLLKIITQKNLNVYVF